MTEEEGFWYRVMRLIGFEDVEEFEFIDETAATGEGEMERQRPYAARTRGGGRRDNGTMGEMEDDEHGRLVSIPGGQRFRLVVLRPRQFDEVQAIADHLKSRRPVIVNLENADQETGQQMMNFLSGAIYALDGEMHRVGAGIIMLAPENVDIDQNQPVRPEEPSEVYE